MRGLPTRTLLDDAAPNTPVFVKRLDGHMALANSEALRRAGVHEDFTAPAGGAVVRDASGRLTGLLKDAAMDVVTRAMPPLSADGLLARARAALRHAAELGVTSIQDMTASAEEFSVYEALLASGELTARISSMQNYDGDYAVDSAQVGLAGASRAEVLFGRLDGIEHGGFLRALQRRCRQLGPAHARS